MGMGEKCVMTFGQRCFLCHLFFFFSLFDTLWSCLTKLFNVFFLLYGQTRTQGQPVYSQRNGMRMEFADKAMDPHPTSRWHQGSEWYEFYRGTSVLLHLGTSQQTYLGVNCVLL